MGPRAGLDIFEKRKITCPCREWTLDLPALPTALCEANCFDWRNSGLYSNRIQMLQKCVMNHLEHSLKQLPGCVTQRPNPRRHGFFPSVASLWCKQDSVLRAS